MSVAPDASRRKTMVKKNNKSDLRSVTKAIMQTEKLPDPAKNMLSNMLGLATGTYKEERVDFQVQVINMVQQVIDEGEAQREAYCREQDAIMEALPGQQEQADKLVEKLASQVESDKAVSQTAKRELAGVAEEYKVCVESVEKCKQEQQGAEIEYEKVVQKKEKLENAYINNFQPILQEGGSVEAVGLMTTMLKKFEYEDHSIHAAAAALSKNANDRTPFDVMVVRELQEATSRQLGALDSAVQAEEPARRERQAALASAEDGCSKARQSQIKMAARYTEVFSTQTRHEKDLEAAMSRVKDLSKQEGKQKRIQDDAINKLNSFRAGPKASLAELVDFSAPPPPSPEPVVEHSAEPAAMEVGIA